MIPLPLRPFFWDIDTESFDPHSHPDYTIERILELGNLEAVRWLQAEFSEAEIRKVLLHARRLSAKSATFWAFVYHIPLNEVPSLR